MIQMSLLNDIVEIIEKVTKGEINIPLVIVKEKLFIKYKEMEKKFTDYEISSSILNSVRVVCETQYTFACHIYERRVSEALSVAKLLGNEDLVTEVLSVIKNTEFVKEISVEERTLDSSGKIIIPRKFREILDLSEGDNIQIELKDNELVFKKKNNSFKNIKLVNTLISSVDVPSGMGIAVCDLRQIIAEKSAYTKNCNKTINNSLNPYLKNIITSSDFMTGTDNHMTGFEDNSVYITERNQNICVKSIYIINPDKGAVILFYKKGQLKEYSPNIEEVLKYISVLLRDY